MDFLTLKLILIIATAVIVFIGVSFLVIGLRRLLRGKFVSGGGLSMSGGLLLALAAFSIALSANLYTYRRLTYEQAVAELTFQQIADHRYRVGLTQPNAAPRTFELQGDEWQLDARVVKWRGAATLLGLDPLYRLERLSGRYHDLQQERQQSNTIHALAKRARIDFWEMARRHGDWLPWIDATFGSATYMPMADNAAYQVKLTNTGLLARPGNSIAESAIANWR